MKQILQNLRSGETRVAELPAPACGRGMVKIQTRNSLISAGTERMLVEFSKGGLIAKAKAQPDKVKQVLDKIKTDGLLPTLDSVFKRLGESTDVVTFCCVISAMIWTEAPSARSTS